MTACNEWDRPYSWYMDLYQRDLGFTDSQMDRRMGFIFAPHEMVESMAEYYLEHPEHAWVGRTMLVRALLDSFGERLRDAGATDDTHVLMRRVMERVMQDPYEVDELGAHWSVPDQPDDPYPLYVWLHKHYPDWQQPKSIWLKVAEEEDQTRPTT